MRGSSAPPVTTNSQHAASALKWSSRALGPVAAVPTRAMAMASGVTGLRCAEYAPPARGGCAMLAAKGVPHAQIPALRDPGARRGLWWWLGHTGSIEPAGRCRDRRARGVRQVQLLHLQ